MVSAEPWARPSEPTPRSPAPCGLGCHRIIVLWGWHTRRSGVPKWPVGAHRSGGCAGPCWTIAGGIFGNAWGGVPEWRGSSSPSLLLHGELTVSILIWTPIPSVFLPHPKALSCPVDTREGGVRFSAQTPTDTSVLSQGGKGDAVGFCERWDFPMADFAPAEVQSRASLPLSATSPTFPVFSRNPQKPA